ncbi:MAG: bifunctional 4-hydroxy-2-oxoglutarate aldolase/2-dehydro-3-deoxy-phosphogluconate aldolase [Alphaproteobacteria bacterium]|jgi:2-dehydro-3-deoxyphosphogluconate aldolase / (4S)-4-hydroxy-2-oxoglutarate aldolase|nr:bifunctional 4-hydroxy-2-oxoglutarate aldolase/2-dehydro-3-deoxy-phosphogluconate aldolase [Alphaproteobacteria bacterium]MBT4086267.1 bifunctional 4-hydroxy-2-oxoglutarate aldolase/2-dehydro-3-deoxy-phosphogluconate aldolase [Alphaproteobacteria bacterium]MBT4543884.1 bifunctional 4-hydroxy-2-oxoglutarate aldolase/2-dehydro-3-deoxy-phosphogluconate aldolase [Alphaproteobacteria bacterium]MBT7745253.1 bifunctional 4-hydroxy-2-oxoglutarate aldolase/2-dehydro-3-deoxy-phosphogluconate aldolase [
MTHTIEELLTLAPVIPVLVIDNLDDAVPLAAALVAGGLPVLEITLRTSVALAAIEAIAASVPEAMVGVGTVTSTVEMEQSINAGATFAVSPGCTSELATKAAGFELPYLPGVANPSDVMRALEHDLSVLKLFPAEAAGGTAMLKALSGPFPQVRFCPTGGIGPDNMLDYLRLDNVMTIGGSWVAPKQDIAAKNWQNITSLAAAAVRKAASAND